jgi:hypothetical protein
MDDMITRTRASTSFLDKGLVNAVERLMNGALSPSRDSHTAWCVEGLSQGTWHVSVTLCHLPRITWISTPCSPTSNTIWFLQDR